MLRRAACLGPAAALLLIATTDVALADPPKCVVVSSSGRCLVEALDPGRPGGPARDRNAGRGAGRDSGGDAGTTDRGPGQSSDNTQPEESAPPPMWMQPVLSPNGGPAGFALGPDRSAELAALLANAGAAPLAAAPVDPQVPARLAISELELSGPVIRSSTGDRGFVGVPIWLWIDHGPTLTGPRTATAAVGNAEVTATGRLSAVEWDMGPPGAQVVCDGPGTPWAGQPGPSPDCGYIYELRSLPDRTGGTGRWPIVATSVWQVEWAGTSGGIPVTGQQTVRVSTDTSLSIGEIQVLVSGGGS